MESALEARKKWNVDWALKDLRSRLEEARCWAAMDSFATVKGYIGLLELDLKNAKEKLDGIRIQPE